MTGTTSIENLLSKLRNADITLSVRGDRLVVDAPEGVVTPNLQTQIATRKDEILRFLAAAAHAEDQPITALEADDTPLPMSFAQQRMWFLDQLQQDATAFNAPLSVRFAGELNIGALTAALSLILHRHDVLRTNFPLRDGEPVVQVRPPAPAELTRIDCSDRPPQARDLVLQEQLLATATTPFDLAHDNLLRCSLLQLADDDHVLLVCMHHIVSDGWSMGIFLRELSDFYSAFDSGVSPTAPELPVQYADFSRWQHAAVTGTKLARDLDYWKRTLAEAPELLDLPTDHPRRAVYQFEGGKVGFAVEPGLVADLAALSEGEHATLFMSLLGGFTALLSRLSGLQDIVVGYPIAGRRHEEVESLIGCFVNTLLLRSQLTDAVTFRQLINEVRETVTQAHEHQDLPFEKLVDELRPERNLGHNPLFQVAFVFQNIPFEADDFPGLSILPRGEQQFTPGATFDLTLVVEQVDGGLRAELEFNRLLFEEATVERMTSMFGAILRAAVQAPDKPIQRLDILDAHTRHDLLRGRNQTDMRYPKDKSVSRLFEVQAATTPEEIAVEEAGKVITYRQLNERANRWANSMHSAGVGPGTIVGIMLKPSIDLLVGLLAIMKTGAAYLPLDASHPQVRIADTIRGAEVNWLLSRASLADQVTLAIDLEILDVEILDAAYAPDAGSSSANLDRPLRAADAAYVMYTSGSTGIPKGVVVEHGALTNYIWWAREVYVGEGGLDFPLHTSISFDLTVTSLYVPLTSGGRLVIYGETEERVPPILRIVQDKSVDVVKLTPSHLALLRDLDLKSSRIRKLIVGGEDLRTDLARRIHDVFGGHVEIYNEYGPTEATVGCMIHRYDPARDTAASVPIGVPAANARIYLLDENHEPVPPGAVGEMFVAGDGVARQYLGQPQQTAERFLPDPFVAGSRMYRTGDLARWRNEGVMEYRGRSDRQVKIRGHRVELSEVEAEICNYTDVRECVVDVVAADIAPRHMADAKNCIDCGLPSNYPGTTFDTRGRCNQCSAYDQYRAKVEPYFRDLSELEQTLASARSDSKGAYDCIALLSGGKDSTYVLSRLVDMGFSVLAYTLDSGYISDQAKQNIQRVVEALGVDHIYGTTPFMGTIFADSLRRHSNVCNGCFKTLYTLSMNLAKQQGIPFVVTGLSRGQLFETRLSNFYRDDDFRAESVDRFTKEARRVYHRLDDAVSRCLDTQIFNDDALFDEIQVIDFFRYCDVSLDELYEYLDRRLPWVLPSDTGRSTNCTLNDAGIYIHKKQRHYHNYAMPYAWDVRMGHKQRDAALEELDDHIDEEAVHQMLREVGYDERDADGRPEARLVAYVVADESLPESALREYLDERLPEAMIPSYFAVIGKIPLAASGKVDRRALSEIPIASDRAEMEFVPPSTPDEQRLVAIWQDVLGPQQIGVRDNFFRLGGHSLLAAQVVARIAEQLHVELPVATLFDRATIEELATLVGDARGGASLDEPDVEDILGDIEAMSEEEAQARLSDSVGTDVDLTPRETP